MHTPGPWKANIRKTGSHVTGPDGFSVAHVGTDDNARLIAAAPKMYQLAVDLLFVLNTFPNEDIPPATKKVLLDDARTAIDKATKP